MADDTMFQSLLNSVAQLNKAYVSEYISGTQLNYLAVVIALFGLCVLFLYYIFTSENEKTKNETKNETKNVVTSEGQKIKDEMLSEIRNLFQNYSRTNGQQEQSLVSKQSPLDITPLITAFDQKIANKYFSFDYDNFNYSAKNLNGLSIIPADTSNFPYFECGVFPDKHFQLEKILFHWGSRQNNGSHHFIDNEGFAGEIQFIHRNTTFSSMMQALKYPGDPGALFISVLLQQGTEDNPALEPLMDVLTQVEYPGTESSRLKNFKPSQLIPADRNEFWLYDGSETTEPFRETVKWILLHAKLSISLSQLQKLRELRKTRKDHELQRLLLSNRDIQPVNGRIVKSSFLWKGL
ncbi:unnamed protein product [Meloidogyne enterolobii]|uniref:Uncharacterized protein n=2 Tax=Meloidogyne enterolobii TaxID=390850 RepID=A0ACB0XLX7_MELEN